MTSLKGPTVSARCLVVVLSLLALTMTACSALELHQQMGSATADAERVSPAARADATRAALETAHADAQATVQLLSAGATQAAVTIAALSTSPTAVATAADPPALPASADTVVYGSVPIDSDRLNLIAALAFDADGRLLVATRAGEVYAMPDSDGDGSADETRLVFADEAQQLGQVAGMIVHGDGLILLNGARLSLLRDSDGDGVYDSVTRLSEGLPVDQSPLQASNGIVQAPDGRLFSVDINAGEILQIFLHE